MKERVQLPIQPGPLIGVSPQLLSSQLAESALANFLQVAPRTVGDVLHRARVVAVLDRVEPREDVRTLLKVVLNTHEFKRKFPLSPHFIYKAPWGGWCVRAAHEVERHSPEADHQIMAQGESHVDQLLATCAEVGIGIDEAIALESEQVKLRDLFEASQMAFVIDQECPWSLVAYSSYTPDRRAWTNRFGEEFSYDEIVGKLIREPMGVGPCAGTHIPYLVAHLLRVNENHQILSEKVRKGCEQYLRRVSRRLVQVQLPTGGWSYDWASSKKASPERERLVNTVGAQVLVAGHTLEWMTLVESDLQVGEEDSLGAAARFIAKAIVNQSPGALEENYGAFSHGARALALLMAVRESP